MVDSGDWRLASRINGDDAVACYGVRPAVRICIFKQTIRNGWQQEMPDNWLRRQTPGGSRAR